MANKILASSQVTIVDLNDQVSLSSNINSNLPKVQYVSNNNFYLPTWSSASPVILTAVLTKIGYGGDNIITTSNVLGVRWYFKLAVKDSQYTEITTVNQGTYGFELVANSGKNAQLKIKKNLMTLNYPGLEIKCEMDYKESWMPLTHTQISEIAFNLSSQGSDGSNGQDSYISCISNENQTIVCDVNGNPIPGQIGTSGIAKFSITAFKGTEALTPVTSISQLGKGKFYVTVKPTSSSGTLTRVEPITGQEDKFYLNGTLGDYGAFELEVSLESADIVQTKTFTYSKTKPGQNPVIAALTNESQTIGTDANGNGGNYSLVKTAIRLYSGSTTISSGVTYALAEKSPSITGGSVSADGVFTMTGLTADTGYVDLKATYKGVDHVKRFTISKAKAGTGQNATSYWMICSPTITLDASNNFVPNTIKVEAMSQTGESTAQPYSGRFLIEESVDSVVWNRVSASEVNESSHSFTPTNKKAKWFKASLYVKDSTISLADVKATPVVLDYQTISVTKDGIDGTPAKVVYLNSNHQHFTTNKSNVVSPANITLSSDIQNIPTPRTIEWWKSVNGGSATKLSNTTESLTIASSEIPKSQYCSYTIKVIKDGVTYSDTKTINHYVEGQDSYSATLSNESHIIACSSSGTPQTGEVGSYTSKASCYITAYKGTQKLTPVAEDTANSALTVNQFKYSITTQTGCQALRYDTAISETQPAFSTFYINSASADSGKVVITFTFYGGKTIVKEMTFVKSKAAINAKVLNISGQNMFKQNSAGVITPSNIKLIADTQGVGTPTIKWQYLNGSTWTDLGTSNNVSFSGTGNKEITISPSTSGWTNNTLRLKAYVSNDSSVYDTFTVSKAIDGINGVSPIGFTIFAPNGKEIYNGNKDSVKIDAFVTEGVLDITKNDNVNYKWYYLNPLTLNPEKKKEANGASGYSYSVPAADIPVSLVIKCEATYKNQTYSQTLSVEDKMDPVQLLAESEGGTTFKNGTGESFLYAKLIQNGKELDPITMLNSLPPTSGYKNGDIIYIKSDGKTGNKPYKKLVNNVWTALAAPPSKDSDSKYTYTWMKQEQNGNKVSAGTGKIIYTNSSQIEQAATFYVTVES